MHEHKIIHITGVPMFTYDHNRVVARSVRYLAEATKIYLDYVNKQGILVGDECEKARKLISDVLCSYKEVSVLSGERPDDDVVRAFNTLMRRTIQFK